MHEPQSRELHQAILTNIQFYISKQCFTTESAQGTGTRGRLHGPHDEGSTGNFILFLVGKGRFLGAFKQLTRVVFVCTVQAERGCKKLAKSGGKGSDADTS